jgi:hypothetical protein
LFYMGGMSGVAWYSGCRLPKTKESEYSGESHHRTRVIPFCDFEGELSTIQGGWLVFVDVVRVCTAFQLRSV